MAKVNYRFALPVSILKEGKTFVAYTPALDLSTAGDTFEEAKQRFEEAVQIFFEEITSHGTANDALLELGWQKQNNDYVPPVVVSHQTQNFSVSSAT